MFTNNLTPPSLGAEAMNAQFQQFNATNKVATLYLFSPRIIPDQTRRPHVYNFNWNFQQDLCDNILRSMNANHTKLDTMMINSDAAKSAIIPTVNGYQQKLSTFSTYWTFILIVDNVNKTGGFAETSLPTRYLFAGLVFDEPVTRGINGKYVPNHQAVFSISHYTQIVMSTYATQGGVVHHPEVTADYDCAMPNIAQAVHVSGAPLFDLQPANLSRSITFGSNNSFFVTPTPMTAGNKSVLIPSELNAPVLHLSKVVNSMIDGCNITANSPFLNNTYSNDGDTLLSAFNNFSGSAPTVMTTIDPGSAITFDQLMAAFPMLNTVVSKIPSEIMYDMDDTHDAPSRRNVMTSIIASTLPPLLIQFGIAEISFRYCSYVRDSPIQVGNNTEGVYSITNCGMLYDATSQQMHNAVSNFMHHLKLILFPIILSNAGQFDMMAHCSVCGTSLVNLNLLDESTGFSAFQETNNIFGGLNSPLIGDNAQFDKNVNDLSTMITSVGNILPNSGEPQLY